MNYDPTTILYECSVAGVPTGIAFFTFPLAEDYLKPERINQANTDVFCMIESRTP